ncbi:hypothetical protein BOTBODRAFT_170755 [Botryobasidium botryosum FD-172 SS1]|uniref:Endonuclease/exonuclease/phosphatase domain-containing protein n=1 Tax=Botryobasidium botryosum (strain FD-172 SS1) TaxID=930990 RepID=A0A067N7E1_BOTB1|nr:hypothetical protein BOTBODRAFT_170755 [Botryobasidium botryosum FD-172 SS1]
MIPHRLVIGQANVAHSQDVANVLLSTSLDFHILFVQEPPWFPTVSGQFISTSHPSWVTIYPLSPVPNSEASRPRVLTYVNHNLTDPAYFRLRPDIMNSLDAQVVNIHIGPTKVHAYNLYWEGKSHQKMIDIFDTLDLHSLPSLFLGDFNTCHRSWAAHPRNHRNAAGTLVRSWIDLNLLRLLSPHRAPTFFDRRRGIRPTCIDLVLATSFPSSSLSDTHSPGLAGTRSSSTTPMQNPRPGYPDRGGSSGPIRSSSRLGHRTPSPSPYARPSSVDEETVPDSQEETVRLPLVPPPPPVSERDRAYFEKAIRGVPSLASAAAEDRGAPFREALIRSFLGAILITAESLGLPSLLSLLRNHPEFGEVVTAIETEAVELWSSTHPMPPNNESPEESGFDRIFGAIPSGKRPEDPTPARLTAIENTLAQVLASLSKNTPSPAVPLPKTGQSSKSGPKKNTTPAPKGKGGPPAPQSTSVGPTPSGDTGSKAPAPLPSQSQSYAAAAASTAKPRKFNPSPKEPSAYRKKKRDEQRFGEVLFSPSPAFPRNNDADCPLSGPGALKTLNEGNALLTPTSPDMWDILAKQGANALSLLHGGRSFHCLTHGPTRDLVIHGIPAKSTDLPKVENICLSLAAGLALDPHDIVREKSRWLVSSRSPNPNKRPLFLVSLTTDEVADRLLHRNPHWIEGDRLTFKEFTTAPTVPNQCRRCWKVGHPTWKCGVSNPICAICAEFHETLSHACPFQGCTERGKACEHAPKTCPNCGGNHPAWEKSCIERLIQKAAQPPKKKATPPAPKKAAPDSPAKATADYIRAIPKGAPGHPVRDISQYKDIKLVKKFRAWCLYNKLPVIGPNDDPAKWAPPHPAST